MRALLVGCGDMAKSWVEAVTSNPLLADRVTLCGVVDRDFEIASQFADDNGLLGIPVFSDLEEALSQTEPDAVFDVTPPDARPFIVQTALKAGKHVLSEKPMAPDMATARALCDTARAENRIFAVTQNRRYKPGARRVQAFLKEGGLGTVTSIHADFFIGPHFGGFREEMDHVLLLDMAIHHFDAARFMLGEEPTAVLCHETNPKGSWYAHGAAVSAIFKMSNEVTFSYNGSWCAEGNPTSWDASWRIVGTGGMLTWDGEEAMTASIATGDEAFLRDSIIVDIPHMPCDRLTQEHVSVIADFVDAVDSDSSPETDCSDNIHSLSMVFGAIESAAQGRTVSLAKD